MLLEILAQAGCRSFIGIGSQAEYGVANEILREDLPLHPVNAYGCTKAAVSMLSEKFCSLVGMRWVWLRLIATYGPADDNKHLIPYIINQLLGCKKPSLSAGKQMWDYLYVDDASKAIRICGENTSISGVMNLASGNVRSIREIAENIRDLINPSLQIGFGEIPYPTNAIMHLQADISKIRNTTGWEPTTSWEQGLAKTIAWFRSR